MLGLEARLEIGASEEQVLGCGWMACSVEDGLGVVSGSSDAEGLFRRRPTRNPSFDRDTEPVEHIRHTQEPIVSCMFSQ